MREEIIVKISVILLVVAGLVLLFGSEALFPDFYRPTLMGVMALLQAITLLAPSYLLWPTTPERRRYLANLQLALILAFALNNAGALGVYRFDEVLQYDKLVHFFNSFILLFASAYFFSGWFRLSLWNAARISFWLIVFGGLAWEFLEFGLDGVFDTVLIGIRGHLKELDTALDVIFDVAGALVALLLLNLRIQNKKDENGKVRFTWR
jgi:hypothetical protein